MLTSAVLLPAQTIITPVSYTASPGETGVYNYFDDTGAQLTDGTLGANGWDANLGNGPSFEWVGWNATNPSLVFTFSAVSTITLVEIGLNRSFAASIFLPSTVVIGGTNFFLTGSEIADNTRGTLAFAGSWTGTTLGISLVDNSVNFIFVDEVRFTGAAIPEPASAALTGALGALVAVVGWRRWSRRQRW